jgi:hypothetical protein
LTEHAPEGPEETEKEALPDPSEEETGKSPIDLKELARLCFQQIAREKGYIRLDKAKMLFEGELPL